LPERVRGIVGEWIERRPLRHLAACRYPGVLKLFAGLRGSGKMIGICSDYPVQAKLDDRFHEIDHGTSGLFADSSFVIG
jgi:hypothetical protein